MAESNQDEQLNNLYKQLHELIQQDQDEDILKTSTEILQLTPHDLEIKQCKIIAMAKLGQYTQATQMLQNKQQDSKTLAFTQVYILYKTNKFVECVKCIEQMEKKFENHPGCQLLKAQILFKESKFDESMQQYLDILKQFENSEDYGDILVNMLCCAFSLSNQNLQKQACAIAEKQLKKDSSLREMLFNLSLVYQCLNQQQEARNLLKKFQKFIEDEGNGSAANLDNQSYSDLIMCLLQQDLTDLPTTHEQLEEKSKFYTQQLEQFEDKQLDKNLKIVLENNLIVIKSSYNKDYSYSDMVKKLDTIIAEEDAKQTKEQKFVLQLNKLIVALIKNKFAESHKIVAEIELTISKPKLLNNIKFVLSKLYLLFKTSKDFNKDLSAFLADVQATESYKTDQKFRNTILLTQAEFNRQKQDYLSSLSSLQSLCESNKEFLESEVFSNFILAIVTKFPELFSHKPIQALVSIINQMNQNVQFMLKVAELFIKTKQYEQAAEIYKKIQKLDPSLASVAQNKLLYCYSFFNQGEMEKLMGNLAKPNVITNINDIQRMLSDLTVFKTQQIPDVEQKQVGAAGTVIQKTKKIKKKKQIKYPKNFDPENPGPMPDPERWLPRYEKSKFKKYKKNKFRGAQGASTGTETVQTFNAKQSTAMQDVSSGNKKSNKNKKKKR